MFASERGVGRVICGCVAILAAFTATAVSADSSAPAAATAADAIKNYWQSMKAGKVDEAVSNYIDTAAMADIAAGSDASVTREQRDAAAKDLQGFLGVAYKQPQVANALKTAEVKIKSEQPAGDGQTTVIEYVVKVTQPSATELENTAYVRKVASGWRIVDTKQPGQPRLTETLHTGWTSSHQKLPSLTFDQYVNMMISSLNRRASSGGAATPKSGR